MKPEELADLLITRLNEILATDRDAIEAVAEHRVPCNQALLNHPTVQVMADGGVNKVGFLGILNGLVGTIPDGPREGWGFIAGCYDDDGKLVRFQRTVPPNAG